MHGGGVVCCDFYVVEILLVRRMRKVLLFLPGSLFEDEAALSCYWLGPWGVYDMICYLWKARTGGADERSVHIAWHSSCSEDMQRDAVHMERFARKIAVPGI